MQTNSAGNEGPQRYPSLSKLGVSILEHIVNQVIGESAIDEIKKPYAQKETFDSLSKAIARVEKQFINQYPSEDARQALLQLPVHSLPVVQNEIWNFYKHPNDKGLENVLTTCLVELHILDNEENKRVVNTYLNILRREFVNIDSELRDKIQALAILDIVEAVKDVKELLNKSENERKVAREVKFQKLDNAQPIPKDNFDGLGVTKPIPQIGIVTALPKEYAAVKATLKNARKYQYPGRGSGHRYLLGEISAKEGGKHLVVLALADMGNNLASLRATQLLEHFPSVNSILMVGIAGGVPHPNKSSEHVRLGDIVISDHQGVVQYDFKKESASETILRYPPRPPSPILWEGVRFLAASEINGRQPWLTIIKQVLKRLNIERPPEASDILVNSENKNEIIPHPHDPKRFFGQPRVFVGPIASANILLKNPNKRDELRDRFGVKAVEMEGSGIADATWSQEAGYLVVRGICDYCDSNKNDEWQQYAAIVAAAYANTLIASLPVQIESKGIISAKIISVGPEVGKAETPEQKKTERRLRRRYKIVDVLGKGSFGIVSRAHDKNINSFVAIKEMELNNLKKVDKDEFSKRFIRESETLSRLTHPNIAKVLDFWKTKKSLYLVMTYLPGGTLEHRLGRPIPYNKAAGLLVPIGKALAYAHKEGFIHRDVKPGNILFTNTEEPVLCDFGLVKSLRAEDSSLTVEGIDGFPFVGTPSYAAPEQWEGSVFVQSDLYALGVIYYEMITGYNPLRTENLTERLINSYLKKPSLYNPELPDIVDQVTLHATARKLEDRYGSMDDFIFHLRKLAIERPLTESFQPKPIEVNEETILRSDEDETKPHAPMGDGLLLLANKFEKEINELIAQKDFTNAERLIRVVERFGSDGQQAASRLRNQIPDQYY